MGFHIKSDHRPLPDTEFLIGDVVVHEKRDLDKEVFYGVVYGYCPGRQWVRVKTDSGKVRIWDKRDLWNMSEDDRKQAAVNG